MTSTSAPATARINRFTAGVVGVVAVVLAMSLGGALLPFIERSLSHTDEFPWLADEPVEAVAEGDGVWSAAGSAHVRLPAGLRGVPLAVELLELDGGHLSLYLGREGVADDYPVFAGSVWDDDPPQVIAGFDDSELWVKAERAWRARIVAPELTELTGEVRGRGDAVFVYHGEATSGTVSWVGDASLYLTGYTIEGYHPLATGELDEPVGSRRFVWQETPYAVIQVEASDELSWTLALDGEDGR